METEEGSPQGGNLSPLLANIYLNEFDQEFLKRGDVYKRQVVIYARVSTKNQKDDLQNQVSFLRQFCNARGIIVDPVSYTHLMCIRDRCTPHILSVIVILGCERCRYLCNFHNY